MSIHVDGLPVRDETEALSLMVHHLELAARYFEATPDPIRSSDLGEDDAMMAWVEVMDARYR